MPKPALDPRSTRIALVYTGDDAGHPYLSGIPARNLTENDVCHLADSRGVTASVILADLTASGLYTPAKED